jgi:hypothetical protein
VSNTMLHGVLNMPPEAWSNSPLDTAQRHGRYVEASNRIQDLERELAEANGLLNIAVGLLSTMPQFENHHPINILICLKNRQLRYGSSRKN